MQLFVFSKSLHCPLEHLFTTFLQVTLKPVKCIYNFKSSLGCTYLSVVSVNLSSTIKYLLRIHYVPDAVPNNGNIFVFMAS